MKRTVFLIFMLSTLLSAISGQTSIEGVVKDKSSGEAITGAHVQLDGIYKTTTTDADGRFVLSRIFPGSYRLEISHIGYQRYDREIIIEKEPVILQIEMEYSVHMSERFIVTALRSDERLSGAATTITKHELKQKNLGQDIPFLLSTTPSAVVTSDAGTGIGYTGLRIRGIDQNRINVTINGIPLNDPESHAVFWVDLPDFASSIEDIQIQRGVGTSTNGPGAFGASINIQTENVSSKPFASMRNVYGSFNTMKNNLNFGSGMINNKFAFDGRISRIVSDGFIDRASSNLYSYYLSGGYYGKNTVLKGVVMSGKEITYQAWGGIPSEILDTNRTWNPMGLYTDHHGNLRAYDNQVDDYKQDHYQLHLLQRFSEEWTANVALHVTTGVGFYESYRANRRFRNYGLPNVVYGNDTITRTDLIDRKWLDNIFYGFTWSAMRTSIFSNLIIGGAANIYDGDHLGTLVWLQHPGTISKNHEYYNNKGIKKDANVFIKYTHNFESGLAFTGDFQVRAIDYKISGIDDDQRDISQNHDFFFINPKIGASYEYNDRHESYLTAGIANREPNRSNFKDVTEGMPVPSAERLFNIETGHKFRYNRFSAIANFYFMQYKDQLVLTGEINNVGAPIMTNVDNSYRAGVEIVAGIMLHERLKWEGNATFSRNKIRDFTAYIDDWDTWSQREEHLGETDISFSPSVIANSLLKFFPVENGSISLLSQYVGSQYLDNTSSKERMLDAWFVNNIQLQYSLAPDVIKEISFNIMLNNIFNVEYETNGWIYRYYEGGVHKAMDGLFPQAGFHILGGVTINF